MWPKDSSLSRPAVIARQTLGGMARSKCEITMEECCNLLKPHAASISLGEWKTDTEDEVVEQFGSFFLAVAASSSRLNAGLVAKAASTVTQLPPGDASLFGNKMSKSFSLASKRSKGSGARQSNVMGQMIKIMKKKGQPPALSRSPSVDSSLPRLSPKTVCSSPEAPHLPESIPDAEGDVPDDEVNVSDDEGDDDPAERELPSPKFPAPIFKDPLTILREVSGIKPKAKPGPKTKAASSNETPTMDVLSSQEELINASPPSLPKIKSKYVDATTFKMVLVLEDNSLAELPLEEGSTGFAECTYGGSKIISEMPNLVLQSKHSRKDGGEPAHKSSKRDAESKKTSKKTSKQTSAKTSKKRPATYLADGEDEEYRQGEEEEEAGEEGTKCETMEYEGDISEASKDRPRYLIMHYKKNNSWGLRQKFGEKRQIMCVCKSKAPPASVEGIARECLVKLNAGEEPEKVKVWSKEQFALV